MLPCISISLHGDQRHTCVVTSTLIMRGICSLGSDEYMQGDGPRRHTFRKDLKVGWTANSYKTWIVSDIATTSVSPVGFTYCDTSR